MPHHWPRSAGVLLHPTSLPGPFGIGDIGPAAYRWVDQLVIGQQSWWQILPLGPTGVGDSPYQSFSAFAGNINLLSPELLAREGLVHDSLWAGQTVPEGPIDFPRVTAFKTALAEAAWQAFQNGAGAKLRPQYEQFLHAEAHWLDGYALFAVIHAAQGGKSLTDWPDELCRRDPTALERMRTAHALEIEKIKFWQFLFDHQWTALKAYANAKGIRIIGDIPIFVAPDSADVWTNRKQFLVSDTCAPQVVAGVPPDYFSADGQLWGNPLYDWDAMARDGYEWWIRRVSFALRQVDLIRLDHFRGFRQAWHIPAGEDTARNGTWVDGPDRQLFDRLNEVIGALPFIAEDLGFITPDVHALRDALELPGMRVLQFSLDTPRNPYLPHNYELNSVVYTGTHDNDTTNSWYAGLSPENKQYLNDLVGHAFGDPAWELIRMAWSSVARMAIVPLQDVLSLGGEARMNVPGHANGNWRWRYREQDIRPGIMEQLAEFTGWFNRLPGEDATS